MNDAPGLAISLDEQPPDYWASLLASAEGTDFFHGRQWNDLAARHHQGLRPFWIGASFQGECVGGLAGLVRRRSLPLGVTLESRESGLEGVSGGPIVRGDMSDKEQDRVFNFLVQSYLRMGRGLFARHGISLNGSQEKRFGHLLADNRDWQRRSVPGAVIDLQNGLENFEAHQMKKNKRNERNRGLRRGAEVFVTSDTAWLERYYPIYKNACLTWGTPPVPLGFLDGLLALGPEKAFFTCVTLEDRVIGGHLNLVHGSRVLAWNGVTDPAFARTHFPATLAVWQDAVESCRRHARWLDLGASGGVVSLAGFKQHFGASLEERGFYVHESPGLRLLNRVQSGLGTIFGRQGNSGKRWHDGEAQS